MNDTLILSLKAVLLHGLLVYLDDIHRNVLDICK